MPYLICLLLLCCSTTLLAADTQTKAAVVFDIDGTLTPRPIKFASVRPDAAKAVQAYANKGYQIIYLSTRPMPQGRAEHWLSERHFPAGIVHISEKLLDPFKAAEFKTRILQQLQAQGWQFAYAYGDSDTDFQAYANVKISQQQVYALKRENKTQCQAGDYQQCLNGWTEHLPFIEAVAAIEPK